MGPIVIDKGQPIKPIGSRLRDHTRTFDSGVRARTNSRRTVPGEGIEWINKYADVKELGFEVVMVEKGLTRYDWSNRGYGLYSTYHEQLALY